MALDYTIFGKYLPATLAGNLFLYKAPAQTLVITGTSGTIPTLWNTSTNKIFVPVALQLGFVSGTTVIGSALMAQTLNAGSSVATGATIVSGTAVAGEATNIGGPSGQSVMTWFPTTVVFAAAPTVISPVSCNLGASDPTNSGHEHVYLFNGTVAFAPGTAMSIVYSVTTSTALYWLTLYGLELTAPVLPLPAY